MKNSEKLTAMRQVMAISREAFASLLGVTERSIYRYERGEREPHTALVRAAEHWLNVEQMRHYWKLTDLTNGRSSDRSGKELKEENK